RAARHNIAARKYAFPRRALRFSIRLDVSPLVCLQPWRRGLHQRVCRSSRRDNRHRKWHLKLRSLDRNRPPPSRSVRLAQLHPHAPCASQPASPVVQKLHRIRQHPKIDAFLLRVLHFFNTRRHLRLAPPVQHVRFLRSQPPCRPDRVQRRVSPADHRHMLPAQTHHRLVIARKFVCMHQVDPRQKFIRRIYPVQVFSGNTQENRQPRARGDKNRVVSFFLKQLVNRNRLTYHHVRLEHDTHLPHRVDLLADYLLRQTKFRYPVHQHSANFMQRLEHMHLVPSLYQIARRAQSRGAASHNRHFLPRRWRIWCRRRSRFLLVVRHKPFQIPDSQRIHFLVQQAEPFAVIFLRTHAARDCRQHVVLADLRRRSQVIALHDQFHEILYLHAYRAIIHARRLRAFQAAQRLLPRQFHRISQVHFREIHHPQFRGLLRHALPRYFHPLFHRHRVRGHFLCRAHSLPPAITTGASLSTPLSHACWYLSSDSFSASRYILLRCISTPKSTWCASNSGPSTHANWLFPPTSTRHPPHIPVPSIMIGFKLTIVFIPCSRVRSATAFIIGTGPTASTSLITAPPDISSRNLSVTSPF